MKVRVKFCGGCNPRYDRVAAYEVLKEKFDLTNEDFADYVVVLAGCRVACVKHQNQIALEKKYVIHNQTEFEQALNELIGLIDK